jgi:hypothetical protein
MPAFPASLMALMRLLVGYEQCGSNEPVGLTGFSGASSGCETTSTSTTPMGKRPMFYFGACAGGFSLVGGTIPLSRK